MRDPGHRIILSGYGESPKDAISTHLSLVDMPFPEVDKLKSTDVVVSVKSSGVAFVDTIMMTGQYQHIVTPPYTPGLEFSGEVVWTGNDVRSFSVGDAVISDFMAVGPRSKGDYKYSGGWASYAVAPEAGLAPLPDGFDWDMGCSLFANYETPYFALVKRANIQAGETVLVTGASGSAGLAAVQMAKLLGATVIVTGRSDAKLAEVKANGANHVINSAEQVNDQGEPQFKQIIKDLTGGRGVDVVYDTVGGVVGLESLRSLSFCGRYVIVGWASNVSDQGGRSGFVPDRLPTNIIQMKGLQILGSPMVIYSMQNPDWRSRQKAQVLEWASAGYLKPNISHRFPLSAYREALDLKLGGGVTGSCVLNP